MSNALSPAELEEIYVGFRDDATFARESCTVLSKNSELVPMILGHAQSQLSASIKRSIAAGRPIREIAYKSRQVWITTFIAMWIFRETISKPGRHSLVLAQDDKTAGNIFETYHRFVEHFRAFRGVIGLPKLITDTLEKLEFDNGSWIQIHTAKTLTIGRSFTLQNLHLSEFAFYGDKAREMMASCMSAVPKNMPGTAVFVETSPNGVGNEFWEMWQRAVSHESEWHPNFFPWQEHAEYTMPLPVEPAAFQASLSTEERELKQLYNLQLEQLQWRRWTIRNDLNGDVKLFEQEYPHSPESGFLTSGRPKLDMKAVARMPVIRDAPEGGLEMVELGAGRKQILWTPRERGELVVYRKPDKHREYLISGDGCEGKDVTEGKGTPDPDWAVGHVWDRDTGEQVARLRARFTEAEFAWQLYLLGVYYHWAQIALENNGTALATIHALLNHGYPSALFYHRIVLPDQDPVERSDLLGWKSTMVTRPQMIAVLEDAVRKMDIIVHDPITLSEMRTFVIKPNGRVEHAARCHDDTVIAAGIGVVAMLEMPRQKKPDSLEKARRKPQTYRTRYDKVVTDFERGQNLRIL